jgi:parallel beta-helix repeat protein
MTNAVTVPIDCNKPAPAGKIRTYLKLLDPQGPNTLRISGTCHENIVIRGFDRLSLIANPGAVLKDASGGQKPVINITDSRRIYIQGFTISGGSSGVLCFDGSLCRFSGNTIQGSTNAGVWVNYSQATFSGDVFQDTGDPGLALEASNVSAGGVTVQRSAGAGIYDADGSVLEAWGMNIKDSGGDGILVVSQSHMVLGGSTVNNNAYNGIDVGDQSEVLLIQNTVTSNNFNGVGIGTLSLAELGNGGSFSGNGLDIGCLGEYSVAANIQAATYGTTNCPVPSAQAGASKQTAPLPRLMRPTVK